MKKTLAVLLLVFINSWASVQIQENTVNRFSFTWTMEGLSIADTTAAAAAISFKNQTIELGDSGQPVIPAFSFYIGIPPKGDIQVQFTPVRSRTVVLKKNLAINKTGKGRSRYPDVSFPTSWLSNARPVVLGKIRGRQFILKPFVYNENTRMLQILEQATCTITFPSSSSAAVGASPAQSAYQRMLSALMLNYAVAQKWSVPASGLAKHAANGQPFALSASYPMLALTIGDGNDGTNEGTVNENGLLKIPGDSLRKLGQNIVMSQIACFASYKGEMPIVTPDMGTLPDGISEIPLLRFDVNRNGLVDSADYLLVYVTGASDWTWDTAANRYAYKLDRYNDYRHYWLSVRQSGSPAPLRPMKKIGNATETITTFVNHILFMQSLAVSHSGGDVDHKDFGGLDWCWKILKPTEPFFSYRVQLPDIDTAFPAKLRINQGERSGSSNSNAQFSNTPICTSCQSSRWYPFTYTGNQNLRISSDSMGQNDYLEIVGLEFSYTTDLDMAGKDRLAVFSPETSAVVQYRLRNLSPQPLYIIRIAADESFQLVDTLTPTQGASYSWIDSAGKGVRYIISTASGLLKSPRCDFLPALQSDNITLHNLRANDNPSVNKADYLVITHPDFMDQARKLATHKNTIGRFQYAKAVDVNDIYREFSGGNLDPAAIRNFLVYASNLWSVKPQFVVLMGKGHYDYKSISDPIFIPIYEWRDRCTDDFYCYLEPGARVDSNSPPVCVPDMFLGRLPCITANQAAQMVSKIIAMEDPAAADLGPWRDRALLVSDDDMQGSLADPLRTDHNDASEKVGEAIFNLRPSVDIRKINMFEYPWNAAWEKPEARNALIGAFNGGAALVNFFGHGNPQQWADENLLNVQLVANLNNMKQYPLVSSFSCSVGKFDQPGQVNLSLSEALMLAPQSGAIATFASMRQAYSENNKQLALAFYNCLFDSTRASVTFGEACTQAKITVGDLNSQIYSYLGDPSISPVVAGHRISLKLIDVSGSSKDTLKALQTVTARGSVLMGDGITVDSRYGTAEKPAFVQVSVFNPPQAAKRKDNGTLNDPSYTLPGTPIFTGQIKVQNGIFNQLLHIPRNVTFNKPGAKAIAFSWNAFDNGLGCKEFIFRGTEADSSGGIDTVGPCIAIKALSDDPAALVALNQDKIQANLPFKCEITVTDSNGIDVTGTGPDEGLTMEIPGCIAKQNINNKFSFLGGDFRKGSATVDFGEGVLKSGTYTLVISAQDLSGNVTRHNFSMEISQTQDLAISRIFNFPNPMKMGTTTAFYYNLSKTSNVRVTIKVYAMSGKLLRVFYNAHSGEVFDGRDQMGNILGPKVYLYQVTAEDLDQQKTVKSGIQKLVVHPPR